MRYQHIIITSTQNLLFPFVSQSDLDKCADDTPLRADTVIHQLPCPLLPICCLQSGYSVEDSHIERANYYRSQHILQIRYMRTVTIFLWLPLSIKDQICGTWKPTKHPMPVQTRHAKNSSVPPSRLPLSGGHAPWRQPWTAKVWRR